jgi:uncharacterized membrane protein
MCTGEKMPSILLINDNKIVSRLLQLSSQKHDYALEEINDYTASEGAYNVIFIDSEKYDEDAWTALKSTVTYDRLGFIGDKTTTKPEGFDFVLEKPFLPTDFVNLMSENFKVMDPNDLPDTLEEMDEIGEEEEELDLDNLDALELDDDLEPLEELDETVVEEIEETIPDIAQTTLTTGIAANLSADEDKEELADLVGEIDNMEVEEEILEEMDLDELVDEKVAESLEEVEADIASTQETVQEVAPEEEVIEEELEEPKAEEENATELGGIAAGVVATATAAVASAVADTAPAEEEIEEALNILDGVEAIESEDDYLKENERIVEDLADEFDSLNEAEVEKLMAGEEIVSEEFSEAEEKVVESNDLEEMITRAVSKAITKEMLQEALNDMEITVTLNTKKR